MLPQLQALESCKVYKHEESEPLFEKPVFTSPLVGPKELIEGQPARFECRVIPVGDPEMDYIWYLNGNELRMASRMATCHDFGYICLDIASTVPEDSGFDLKLFKLNQKLIEIMITFRGLYD